MGGVVVSSHPSGVRAIALDAAASGNVLSDELLEELRRAIDQAAADAGVRALVLTGAGRSFCLGGDVRELAASLDEPGGPREYWRPRLDELEAIILAIRSAPFPVIAAINGPAAGSGFALALSCDFKVAADRAVFDVAYGRLGSSTDGGLAWLLAHTIGPAAAAAVLLEQRMIRARSALAMGLVNDVVPSGELLAHSLKLATSLASAAPHAVRAAKRLLHVAPALPLAAHLRLEHEEFLAGLETADLRRGLTTRADGGFADFRPDGS